MANSTIIRAGRVCTYILGIALIFIGILGLINDIGQGGASFHPFASGVFDVSLIICGIFACTVIRLRYGGGFRSILGIFLVGGGLTSATAILEAYMRGEHFRNPAMFYFKAAGFTAAGICCLAWGHICHQKGKKLPPKTLQRL
jgi:hypothetical protein